MRTTKVSLLVGAVLLGVVGAPLPANGERSPPGNTPNIGSLFLSDAHPPKTPAQVLAELVAYNAQERASERRGTVPFRVYRAQSGRLRRIRRDLEGLEGRGTLTVLSPKMTAAIRSELVSVFEHADRVPELVGAVDDVVVRRTELERTEDLIRIALVANLRFGFNLREVRGLLVYPGNS